jgi:hypothetical protein
MALTINIDSDEKISLEEFVEYVERNNDVRDEASLEDAAFMLKALSNNKSFFTEKLNDELRNWEDFQNVNRYTAQTFTFWKGKDFLVRANIWVPPAAIPQEQTWTNEMFYYLVPHDHNFSFLTAGYWGSGYETTIYEYDGSKITGNLGEKVDLSFSETTTLPEGKIMLYRASKDIHSQSHPEEFSISLNLLVNTPEQRYTDQYCFDFESETISSHVGTVNMSHLMLLKIATHVGNGQSVNLLEALAEKHPSPRIRFEAFASLVTLAPGDSELIWKNALSDKSSYVQREVESRLN